MLRAGEFFCSSKGQVGPEAGDVLQVEEGSCCDLVDVGQEGEGGVKNDSKVVDLGGAGEGQCSYVFQ